MYESNDEIAAASDHNLPISSKRQIELVKLSNDIWHHIKVQHNCTSIEAQLIAAILTTFAHSDN